MQTVRAALYLDFDNVFSGLLKLDPDAALAFAERPGEWLERLAERHTVLGTRNWLVRRCYMNPAGGVPNPDPLSESRRLYFSKYRPNFTRSGFEVIDCPSLTFRSKNLADIRMVLDAMDALAASTTYDEFVIASGDSDLTPLLVRLRAADRRTTIVSPSDASEAFTTIADRLIDGEAALELLQEEPLSVEEVLSLDEPPALARLESSSPGPNGAPAIADGPETGGPKTEGPKTEGPATDGPVVDVADDEPLMVPRARFAHFVRRRYELATAPLGLAALADEARREIGPAEETNGWLGHQTFTRALASLGLPHMVLSQHYIWDSERHQAPVPGDGAGFSLPEPVRRVCLVVNVPKLPKDAWPPVYDVLARYAASHRYNLTEATRWSRDELAAQGNDTSRSVLGFVIRGALFGGAPLYETPPPSAEQIAAAFAANVVSRAGAADMELSTADVQVIADWLNAPVPRLDEDE